MWVTAGSAGSDRGVGSQSGSGRASPRARSPRAVLRGEGKRGSPAPLGADGSEHRAAQLPGDPGTAWGGNVGRPSPEPPRPPRPQLPRDRTGAEAVSSKDSRGSSAPSRGSSAPPGSEPLCRGWDADAALGWEPAALSPMWAPWCLWLRVPALLPTATDAAGAGPGSVLPFQPVGPTGGGRDCVLTPQCGEGWGSCPAGRSRSAPHRWPLSPRRPHFQHRQPRADSRRSPCVISPPGRARPLC